MQYNTEGISITPKRESMDLQHINSKERRSIFALASIFSLRMLGLFMIYPIFTLYATQLKGSTPTLIGVALGIYGLTQACLQIPFGMLSDKVGRKVIIASGLVLFCVGSIVAALSSSIDGVIIGRALQGAGAIGSTTIALIADLTREEKRTKAMAIVGMCIGISFTIALVAGPLLNSIIHVSGIFWLTAILAILGIVVLYVLVPNPTHCILHRDAQTVPTQFLTVLKDIELLRLDFGILALHAILMACFVVLPVALTEKAHLTVHDQWYLYLPILVIAFFTMVPFIIIAEKKHKMKPVFLGAIITVIVGQIILWLGHSNLIAIIIGLYLFFTAFNLLEASLPSMISKQAPAGYKGTAMGIYSSSQFLGIFIGGSIGGYLYGLHHVSDVFLFCAFIGALWLIFVIGMKKPKHLSTFMINLGHVSNQRANEIADELKQIPGVADLMISPEGVAYLKIDSQTADKTTLLKYATNEEELNKS